MGNIEPIGEILARIQKKTDLFDSTNEADQSYLRKMWLQTMKEHVKNVLGEEYLAFDFQKCQKSSRIHELSEATAGAIMLCGPPGTGKTTSGVFLALKIAEYLGQKAQKEHGSLPDPESFALFVTAPDLFRKLGQLYGYAGEDGDRLIEQASNARILMIDDLGAEAGNEDACAAFYEIMNRRYGKRKRTVTIICTNVMPSEWENYRKDVRFARMADRWRQDGQCVVLAGKSMRTPKGGA